MKAVKMDRESSKRPSVRWPARLWKNSWPRDSESTISKENQVIVKRLADIIGTKDDVDTDGWNSRRLLLKDAGMGYSVHDTVIKEGAELHMHYKNHLEAGYLIEGQGEIETVADGKVYPLEAFTIYALDQHDKHILRANKGSHMRMVCVFNPPVSGREVQGDDGAYPADLD